MNDTIVVDSFKVRIPFEQVGAIPEGLNIELEITNKHSGEVLSHWSLAELGLNTRTRSVNVSNDRRATYVSVSIAQRTISKIQRTYLELKITSKLLKQNYYSGITLQTLPLIVEYLNSVGVAITETQLLKSEITDTDFRQDITILPERWQDIVTHIKAQAIPSTQVGRGFNVFSRKDNVGIEFASRSKATLSNPFVKIYSKTLDSLSEAHKNFFEHYKLSTPENLFRVEFTLKNKEHFSYYGIENTLEGCLSLSQEKLSSIKADILGKHIHILAPTPPNQPTNQRMDTKSNSIYWVLYWGLQANQPFETVRMFYLQSIPNRQTRYEYAKLFDRVHSEMLLGKNEAYTSKVELTSLLQKIGILQIV